MEQWRTMPWSWLVSVAPAGCGVVSIFWARWREPYRESVGVHWKRASSPSKKSNCRVRSGLEICTGGKKKSVPCHESSRSKSSAAPQWLWEYKYTDTAWDFLSVKKKKIVCNSESFISCDIDYASAAPAVLIFKCDSYSHCGLFWQTAE